MKRSIKKMISTALAALFILSVFTCTAGAANVSDFEDVHPSDWYYEAVDYAVGSGLFNGTDAAAFSPHVQMSRGMFVTVLGRLAGVPEEYGAGKENPFADISSKDYFYPYTLWAVDNGITGGIGSGCFGPHGSVSREQIATFLYRYFQKCGFALKEQESPFSLFPDAGSASGYAVDPLKWATAYGVMGGTGGKLDPSGLASRAQVAQMLLNFSKLDQYKDDGADPEPTPSPEPSPSPDPDVDPDETPSPTPKPWENYDPDYDLPTGRSEIDANGGYYDYDLANEILRQFNELRESLGLGTLKRHPMLENWAAIRAKEQDSNIGHTRPTGERWDTVGVKLHSENLHVCNGLDRYLNQSLQNCANASITGWYNSEGHRLNMTREIDKVTGIAVYVSGDNYYVIQLFSQYNCYYYDFDAPNLVSRR